MSLVIWSFFFILVGFVMLYVGGDFVVAGAVRLADRLGVKPIVIGLTVVAFGTSLPELLVSLLSATQGHDAVAVGNILGSNVFNIGLIVGVSALLSSSLPGSSVVMKRDMPVLILGMILFGILGRDLLFSFRDGSILMLLFAVYMVLTVTFPVRIDDDDLPDEVKNIDHTPYLGRLVLGLVLLPVGAHLLVRGGVDLARSLGISERFISMTLVSWGTSLPEMATSLTAAYRGHTSICIGNVVGSNIFNTVLIMGATSMVTPVALTAVVLQIDYVLALFMTLLLAFLMRGGRSIGRVGGTILLVSFLCMFVLLSF